MCVGDRIVAKTILDLCQKRWSVTWWIEIDFPVITRTSQNQIPHHRYSFASNTIIDHGLGPMAFGHGQMICGRWNFFLRKFAINVLHHIMRDVRRSVSPERTKYRARNLPVLVNCQDHIAEYLLFCKGNLSNKHGSSEFGTELTWGQASEIHEDNELLKWSIPYPTIP